MTTHTSIRSFLIWVLGGLLILGGLSVLSISTGLVDYNGPLLPVVAGAVALLAIPFLARWLVKRQEWWALIIAWAFAGTALWLMLLFVDLPYPQLLLMAALIEVAIPFGVAYGLDRGRWWALIPVYVLLALSGLLGLTIFNISRETLGAFALLMLALPFWVIYLLNRRQKWPLVPAAVLSLIGAGVLTYFSIVKPAGSAAFFAVLSATLGLIFLAAWITNRRLDWGLWIAIGFGGSAILAIWYPTLASWSVVALVAGAYLIYGQIRAARQRAPAPSPQAQQPAASPASPTPSASTAPASSPAATPPPARPSDGETQEPSSGDKKPLTGFRPINAFDIKKSDEE